MGGGYLMGSVGYRFCDLVRGKVYNVGVTYIDASVEPGWWRKVGGEGNFDDVEEVVFPDLRDDVAKGVAL